MALGLSREPKEQAGPQKQNEVKKAEKKRVQTLSLRVG